MLPEKSVSQEVLDSIRLAVGEGKTDLQISKILHKQVKEIYEIRRNILKITLSGRKRKCEKCEKQKATICFNSKSKYPDWCILCRRKYGNEKRQKSEVKLGRPFGKKEFVNKKKEICVCLRCDKVFDSEIFIGLGGREEHYKLCKKCRNIISNMEHVSI